ncbi:hypothetical protein H0H93_006172, partial [Arthromyces matolae]
MVSILFLPRTLPRLGPLAPARTLGPVITPSNKVAYVVGIAPTPKDLPHPNAMDCSKKHYIITVGQRVGIF